MSMPDHVRLHARIHGLVQGVSFRYYTVREARQLGIRGWVRNCADGAVEVVAEAPRMTLNRFLSWLEDGPPSAEVEQVEVHWAEATGDLYGFEVRF
jgi:acylphosphatase